MSIEIVESLYPEAQSLPSPDMSRDQAIKRPDNLWEVSVSY